MGFWLGTQLISTSGVRAYTRKLIACGAEGLNGDGARDARHGDDARDACHDHDARDASNGRDAHDSDAGDGNDDVYNSGEGHSSEEEDHNKARSHKRMA